MPSKRQLFVKHAVIYLKRKLHFFSVAFFTGISEMYSESSRTSEMVHFAKIVNG